MLGRKLTELIPKNADADWGAKFPDGSRSLGEGLHFDYFHETYHVGQMGLLW